MQISRRSRLNCLCEINDSSTRAAADHGTVQAHPCAGEESDELVEQALALVMLNHPVLVAEHEVLNEQTRQKSWDATFTTGFSVTDTFESGEAGPNAAFRVNDPAV